jgi:hypothetical protein
MNTMQILLQLQQIQLIAAGPRQRSHSSFPSPAGLITMFYSLTALGNMQLIGIDYEECDHAQ